MAVLEQLQAQLKSSQDRYNSSGTSDYVKQAAQSRMSNIQQQIDSQAKGMTQPAPYIGQSLQYGKVTTNNAPSSTFNETMNSVGKAPNIANAINSGNATGTTNTNGTSTNTGSTWKDSQEYKDLTAQNDKLKQDQSDYKAYSESEIKKREDSYNQILESRRAAVRAAIQKSTGQLQQKINEAPQEFQVQRDVVSSNREKNLVNIRRSLANLGYNPDSYLTRQEQTNVNVGAENQINNLDIAQKKLIDDANMAIQQLQAQGNIEDASAIADITMQKMNALDNLKQNFISNNTAMSNQIYNNISGLMQFNANQANADRTRLDNLYQNQGLTLDPTTNTYVKTFDANRLEKADADTKLQNVKNEYIKSITGLGNQFDYSGEINKVKNDGDTSNDWKIPFLQQEREKKVQTNLKNEIDNIGQFANDYQAEINRRQQTPDTIDDALIPYLKNVREQKLQTMKSNKLTQQQQQQKDALSILKELGIATPNIASALGIPEGSKTTDYLKTQYDTSKPYYKPDDGSSNSSTTKMTTQQKNQSMSEDIKDLTNMSVKDAVNTLVTNKPQLISVYGTAGFKQLWDTALGNAIRMGQAQRYNDYYKTQE